jgi:hypothetical protein
MRMRGARLGFAGAVLLVAGMAIAACAPSPGYETAAAVGWATLQADREPVATNELGRAVVRADASTLAGETTVTLAEQSAVTDVRVRCDGGQTIWVEARAHGEQRGAAMNVTTGDRVACDLKDHVIALRADAGFVTSSVVLRAYAATATAAVVAVEGTASTDPWEGYFDDAMADPAQQSAMSIYGTFGPRDAVQVASGTDESTPAGHHTVELTCVGPAVVTVTAWPIRSDGGVAGRDIGAVWTDAACPATATIEIDTTHDGLGISADSHGQQGAFVLRVDPGSPLDAPDTSTNG